MCVACCCVACTACMQLLHRGLLLYGGRGVGCEWAGHWRRVCKVMNFVNGCWLFVILVFAQ
jgi:hypothetical protein